MTSYPKVMEFVKIGIFYVFFAFHTYFEALFGPCIDFPKSVITNIVAFTNYKRQVSENGSKSVRTTIGLGVGVILQKGKH